MQLSALHPLVYLGIAAYGTYQDCWLLVIDGGFPARHLFHVSHQVGGSELHAAVFFLVITQCGRS